MNRMMNLRLRVQSRYNVKRIFISGAKYMEPVNTAQIERE